MECQVCRVGEAVEGEECSYCGATVLSVLGKGRPLPLEVVVEERERRRSLKLAREARLVQRAEHHAVVGALLFALCGCGLAGATLCNMSALELIEAHLGANAASSTDAAERCAAATSGPGTVALKFLLAFPLAALLGAPAGYTASRLEGGIGLGALVGAGAFGLGAVLLLIDGIFGSVNPPFALVLCAFVGSVPGACAGCVLGWQTGSEQP
ncbi:MAG: hypothetical protein ACYS9X_10155 [Planctomycetota bacterium]|jgi:hypothetical protein